MYDIFKNVINTGVYVLEDIITKIKTSWAWGDITEEQMNELIKLAQENANSELSVDLFKKVEELEKRVIVLENAEKPKPPTEEYPPYEVGKWYYNGDKVTFEEKKYTCIAPEGTACVWSPKDYPAYWEEVVQV